MVAATRRCRRALGAAWRGRNRPVAHGRRHRGARFPALGPGICRGTVGEGEAAKASGYGGSRRARARATRVQRRGHSAGRDRRQWVRKAIRTVMSVVGPRRPIVDPSASGLSPPVPPDFPPTTTGTYKIPRECKWERASTISATSRLAIRSGRGSPRRPKKSKRSPPAHSSVTKNRRWPV